MISKNSNEEKFVSVRSINILYQDDYICAIKKESGHIVHKTRGAGNSPVILQKLRDQIGQSIYPVHRLDRGTSGAMIFALSSEVAKRLQEQLQTAQKKYQALCLGHLDGEGLIDRELTSETKVKQKAFTKYRILEKFEKYSLLELELITGRKNQIRRHLSFKGHHIIGDVNHGKGWLNRKFRETYNFHRLFLHCHFLSLIHPVNGSQINIHCDLDKELSELLERLRDQNNTKVC